MATGDRRVFANICPSFGTVQVHTFHQTNTSRQSYTLSAMLNGTGRRRPTDILYADRHAGPDVAHHSASQLGGGGLRAAGPCLCSRRHSSVDRRGRSVVQREAKTYRKTSAAALLLPSPLRCDTRWIQSTLAVLSQYIRAEQS